MSPDLPLLPIVSQFGKYLKVIIVLEESVPDVSSNLRNAFDIMARAASQKGVPQPYLQRNQKYKLYNDILTFCEKEQLMWNGDEINTLGVGFVRCVCDALWYIDSHHHVFASRGCPIPAVFAQFQGYNIPEISKHRKRAVTNMTSDELGALASRLFRVLQSSFLERPAWQQMKGSLETFAHCLSKYSSELCSKNKTMKLVHSSSTPWRTVSKGLDIFYLVPTTGALTETVEKLNSKVIEARPYSFVDLHDFAPSNPKRWYHFIKDIKTGLKVPAMLLMYSAPRHKCPKF